MAAPARPEVRALWIDSAHPGIRSDAEIRELVDAARRNHVNTLFVQVRRRGETLYAGVFEPPFTDPAYDPSFDALEAGEVEIQVANPMLDLRVEMFARISLKLGGQRKGILVPREAIVYRSEHSGVFILNGNRAAFRPVQAGITQQTVLGIVDGLTLGERIVSMGASLLKDGDQVRLQGERRPPGGPGEGASRPAAKANRSRS